MNLFNGYSGTQLVLELFARILIVFLVLPVHECAHAFAAKKFGDDTAERQGRITLNPIAHIDIFGAFLLVLTGFGWAKPVPINPNRMKNPKLGISITALAGPLSNLIVALIMMIVLRIIDAVDIGQTTVVVYVFYLIYFFIQVNIGLAVFNLIPVPPLDGDKVLSYFTPYNYKMWMMQHQQVVSIVFLVIVLTGILNTPLGFLQNLIYKFFVLITNWIPLIIK